MKCDNNFERTMFSQEMICHSVDDFVTVGRKRCAHESLSDVSFVEAVQNMMDSSDSGACDEGVNPPRNKVSTAGAVQCAAVLKIYVAQMG